MYGPQRSSRTNSGEKTISPTVTLIRQSESRQYRRIVANELSQIRAGSRMEKILMLFMDSGILYCAIMVRKAHHVWIVDKLSF